MDQLREFVLFVLFITAQIKMVPSMSRKLLLSFFSTVYASQIWPLNRLPLNAQHTESLPFHYQNICKDKRYIFAPQMK